MFAIKDLGMLKLVSQFKRAWDSSIEDESDQWGFESYRIKKELKIEPDKDKPFPINVDGSTMICKYSATFRIVDQIKLISR